MANEVQFGLFIPVEHSVHMTHQESNGNMDIEQAEFSYRMKINIILLKKTASLCGLLKTL